MKAYLVFNELSDTRVVPSVAAARIHLEALAETLIDQRIKGTRVLVTPDQFSSPSDCSRILQSLGHKILPKLHR